MLKHRVIPCLLLQDNGLVKTCRFRNPRYIGDPINAIRIFNEKEVDELMVLDITASKVGHDPPYSLIETFASECFMPVCYGGGIATVDQARTLFSLGIEKVCLQTHALENLDLVRNIATLFGSQSIVVSIDIKTNFVGRHRLYSAATGKILQRSWFSFLEEAVAAGVGEIMLTAVDRDGTLSGMDLPLIEFAARRCPVPLIVSGGAATLSDLRAAVDAGASAIAAGAMFVFHGPHRAVLITYPKYADLVTLFRS